MTSTLRAPVTAHAPIHEPARRIDVRDPMIIGVAALTLLTFVLRLTQIRQGLYGDEVWTYQDIFGRSFRSVLTNVHSGGENSPPLFFLMAYATAKLGDPTVWIRLPSLVLGAATVPVVYLIGRETVGRAAGLVAGVVLALSPFSFYYGVEARPYASMAFFVAVSTWALLRAVDTDRRQWWVVYVVAAAAAAYCHYTAIFVLFVQGVWSLWACRDRIRTPIVAGAAAIVLYTPWLPQLRGKELAVIGALHPLTFDNVISDLMRPIAGYPNAPLRAIPTYLGLALVIVCALAGAAALTRSSLRAGHGRLPGSWPGRFWLLAALALATPVGMLLYSTTQTDLWLPRGLYASVPAAALVLGTLLTSIPRPAMYAALALVVGTLVVGTFRAASASWARPPSRAEAAYLDRYAPSSDPVSIVSFIGEPAIISQLHHYHHNYKLTQVWRATPRGGEAFILIDELFVKKLKRHVANVPPAPKGFVMIRTKHFTSAVAPMDITTYRRIS
jgi:uncharacterized membrane protein